MSRRVNDGFKVAYKQGTRAKAVVRILLENTGRTRGGFASDYNYVRDVAQFGNESGFITSAQMSVLGRIYNRVIGNGQQRSWTRLG